MFLPLHKFTLTKHLFFWKWILTERPGFIRDFSHPLITCISCGISVVLFTFKFRRTRSMKNIQQFSLVSWSPAPFTSFLMPEMIFSTSSSAKSPGISPEANRSLISTRKLSSGTCASVNKNTVPMFFKPAFWHKFARSSWPKGEKQKTNSS